MGAASVGGISIHHCCVRVPLGAVAVVSISSYRCWTRGPMGAVAVVDLRILAVSNIDDI
jgi:hypothetical protein